jgi:hypothetical protein
MPEPPESPELDDDDAEEPELADDPEEPGLVADPEEPDEVPPDDAAVPAPLAVPACEDPGST